MYLKNAMHIREGNAIIKYRKKLRSRYATFVYYNYKRVVCEHHVPSRRRDRDPSRMPVKRLERLYSI